jgi:hypothetical protein
MILLLDIYSTRPNRECEMKARCPSVKGQTRSFRKIEFVPSRILTTYENIVRGVSGARIKVETSGCEIKLEDA